MRFINLLTLCLLVLLSACNLFRSQPTQRPVIPQDGGSFSSLRAEDNDDDINSYQKCVDAGYPVMKSLPEQCRTAGGKHFVNTESSVPHLAAPTYTAYQEGVIGNGREAVLFFHASWCPYCQAHDANLRSWLGSQDLERTVYKIDYDTALELRKQFDVVQQDTFILIDGEGNAVKTIIFPSESTLRDLVQ